MGVYLKNQSDSLIKEATPAPSNSPKSRLSSLIAVCSFCLQVLSELPICNLIIQGIEKLFSLRTRIKKMDTDKPLNDKSIFVINPPLPPPLHTACRAFALSVPTPLLPEAPANQLSINEEHQTLAKATNEPTASAGENLSLSQDLMISPTAIIEDPLVNPFEYAENKTLTNNQAQDIVSGGNPAFDLTDVAVAVGKIFEERIEPVLTDINRDETSAAPTTSTAEIILASNKTEVNATNELLVTQEISEIASDFVPAAPSAEDTSNNAEDEVPEVGQTLFLSSPSGERELEIMVSICEGVEPTTTQVDSNEVFDASVVKQESPALYRSLEQPTLEDLAKQKAVSKASFKTTRVSKKRRKRHKKIPTPTKPKKASWSVAKVIKLIFLGTLGAYIGSYSENLVPKAISPVISNAPANFIKLNAVANEFSTTTTVSDDAVPPLELITASSSECADVGMPTTPSVKLPIEPLIKIDVPIEPIPVESIKVDATPPIVIEPAPLKSKQKICVFTSYTQDNANRLQMSRTVMENQRAYAQANDYQYIVREENLAVDVDPITGARVTFLPYWSKIAFINNILNGQDSAITEKPDWLVWMDDDVVVTNSQVGLEEVIAHYTKDKKVNFFVTQDSMSHIFTQISLNSAVLFIRNNNWSRKFFSNVWKMRNTNVNSLYTYGNCPNQSCLHEQQAITDLIKRTPKLQRRVRIIPQRDIENNWGINTFHRWSHWDAARHMQLNYGADLPESKWNPGDFLGQCTGLAVEYRWACVKHLLNHSV